jgi:hypothetical protein
LKARLVLVEEELNYEEALLREISKTFPNKVMFELIAPADTGRD